MREGSIFRVLLACIFLFSISTRIEAKNTKTGKCLATGLDVLRETRDIQRFRATFDLETVSFVSIYEFI